MGALSGLEPKGVFQYFEEICAIPHGSGNLDGLAQYCVDFARARGLRCDRDAENNVIIYQDAAPGCEAAEPLILQGHLDMVCEKEEGLAFDFLRDGIVPLTDGQRVWAQGTTLGADNGIAVALILALLDEEELRHPALELVLTAEEETDMSGAHRLDYGKLRGRRMINLDSEDEGILTCSSAGGTDVVLSLPVARARAEGTALCLELSGLTGGHSGAEIHKGVANVNVLMRRLLAALRPVCALRIAELEGGSRANVIPVSARATVVVEDAWAEAAAERIQHCWAELKSEYAATDPEMALRLTQRPAFTGTALTEADAGRVLNLLLALPHGVLAMSPDLAGLVQTSTNFAIVRLGAERLQIESSIRSALESQKNAVFARIAAIAELAGAEAARRGDYPGWRYEPHSALRDFAAAAYEQVSGKKASVEAIHAGLECGLFVHHLPGLDCISIGPDLRGVHTTSEYLDVASCRRFYEMLKNILSACAEAAAAQ